MMLLSTTISYTVKSKTVHSFLYCDACSLAFVLNYIYLSLSLSRVHVLLLGISNLVIAGCGTSYYASLYGAKLMRDIEVNSTQ